VRAVGLSNNEGRYLAVKTEWGEYQYYHLNKVLVKQGDRVFEGTNIAESGDTGVVTGPNLHVQTWKDGILTNPLSLISEAPVNTERGYVMPPGGNLSYAAKQLGISLDELLNANPEYRENPDFVLTGAVLNVPSKNAPNTYVVKDGDTLWAIGQEHGQSVAQLLEKNPEFKSNPGLIHPGDEIKL